MSGRLLADLRLLIPRGLNLTEDEAAAHDVTDADWETWSDATPEGAATRVSTIEVNGFLVYLVCGQVEGQPAGVTHVLSFDGPEWRDYLGGIVDGDFDFVGQEAEAS